MKKVSIAVLVCVVALAGLAVFLCSRKSTAVEKPEKFFGKGVGWDMSKGAFPMFGLETEEVADIVTQMIVGGYIRTATSYCPHVEVFTYPEGQITVSFQDVFIGSEPVDAMLNSETKLTGSWEVKPYGGEMPDDLEKVVLSFSFPIGQLLDKNTLQIGNMTFEFHKIESELWKIWYLPRLKTKEEDDASYIVDIVTSFPIDFEGVKIETEKWKDLLEMLKARIVI